MDKDKKNQPPKSRKNKEDEINQSKETEPEDEDFVFEEDGEGHSAVNNPEKTISKLRQRLKDCQEEKDKYLNDLYRAKADFINAKKRDEESNRKIIKLANENLIKDMIPVVDSFNMAFANKEAWEQISEEWRKGVEHIYNQLLSALKTNGLEEIDPWGEKFNPQFHEALDSVKTKDEADDQKVVEVVQKGYLLNDQVVKTAKVKVGKWDGDS